MARNIVDSTAITKLMEKGNLGMLMGTRMKASGSMIKLMVSVSMSTETVLGLRATGSMICSMGKELNYGQMGQSTREVTSAG